MTAMICFRRRTKEDEQQIGRNDCSELCLQAQRLAPPKKGKSNNKNEEDKQVEEKHMIRNDCNELLLHARWLVTERKNRKNKKQTGRTRRGNNK